MKFIKFTSIIALQALTACGGGSESGTEGTEISSLSTLTQHTHSAQQTSHTYGQGIAEQLNSTPATSLYTEQQVDHVNGQDEQQVSEPQNLYPTQGLQQVWRRYVNTVKNTAPQNVSDQFKPKQLLLTYPTNATEQIDTSSNLPPIDSILNPIPIDSLETQGLPLVYSKHTSSMLFPAPTMRPNAEQQNTHPTQGLQQVWRRYVNTVKNTAPQNVSDQFKPKQLLLTYPTNATEQIDTSSNLPPIDSILNPIPIDSLKTRGLPLVYSKHTSSMLFPAPTMRPNAEQQNTHPTQGLQQVWRRYVNTVKNTATQNASDQFKPKQLLLTYPTNATEQIDTSSNLPPIDSILNPIPIDSLKTQRLPLVYSKHTSSMLFPEPTMRPNVEQQTNLSDGQDKKVETEPQETPLTQSSGQLQSNSINELKAEPPSSFTQDFTPSKTYGEPITPPDEEQKTNHIGGTQKEGGGKSTGNQATIPTPPRSPSFSDQSYSLDIESEESQSLGQQPDSHVHTNNITAINTDHASGTKNPTESKISDNMDKATMIVTREEKPAQIPVQELLNEENNYPDFQDAAILLIFNDNNHFAATLVKDDENNWYGISNYFSEKIIKLQTNHKNWLDQNISNKERTKIVYFTQRQLDNIEPITIDELTNSLASLPEQTDQSIIDALGELPSGSICVEQSSTEDEAKWVRSFLENIFFSKELLTNDHIDKLKKAVMHSRAKRQISDDTESFIKEALNSIKDCAPNDESYKAMVNNRRTILYKSFGMIKNHDINTFKIDPIIYNSIVSFYGNPYLSYSPEEENSFVEVANNNKIKRAITDDEDFVIININTP